MMGHRSIVRPPVFYLFAVIVFASAVGEPVFYMEIPFLYGMAGITLIVAVDEATQILNKLRKHPNGLSPNSTRTVVSAGCIDAQIISEAELSHQELFMKLRQSGVRQLGEVERAYREADGRYSVSRYPPGQVRPGLPIVPPWDIQQPVIYRPGIIVPDDGIYACTNCGETIHLSSQEQFLRCSRCQGDQWTLAAMPLEHLDNKVDPFIQPSS
jgi:uncharacterized membrane protein YcaP (DUF421 family)